MEARFNVSKEERRALVTAVSEIAGVKEEYQGAPGFAFKVGGYIIDKVGTITFDEAASPSEVSALIAALVERGFRHESGDCEALPAEPQSIEGELEDASAPDTLTLEVPLDGFSVGSVIRLKKIVAGKAALLRKSLGFTDSGDSLPIQQTDSSLQFPWFSLPASQAEIDAYTKLVIALSDMAKKQRRVTMQKADVESEKFAMRCFLLRLGFIGNEYKSARRILLSRMTGNGSFKSRSQGKAATAADSGSDSVGAVAVSDYENIADKPATGGNTEPVPRRCADCDFHCYYTDGTMHSKEGTAIDTSKRTPERYTHYCLKAPSGYRKIKNGAEWSGVESPVSWCPLIAKARASAQ